MNSVERAVLEPLFEAEVTDVVLELSTRPTMMSWYLREFADQWGSEHVQAELTEEKKITTDLRVEVEALRAAHGGCKKK